MPNAPEPNRRNPTANRARQFPDRTDLRWVLLALAALALGSIVMLLRARILSQDDGPKSAPSSATQPLVDPDRPRTGTR